MRETGSANEIAPGDDSRREDRNGIRTSTRSALGAGIAQLEMQLRLGQFAFGG